MTAAHKGGPHEALAAFRVALPLPERVAVLEHQIEVLLLQRTQDHDELLVVQRGVCERELRRLIERALKKRGQDEVKRTDEAVRILETLFRVAEELGIQLRARVNIAATSSAPGATP